ncbi:hypothetical protein AGMMS4956_07670 [Bacteroidia bacterium]|nr:hypothetical protein AGMMS4956_07670 [Bacteroidia bacterium]
MNVLRYWVWVVIVFFGNARAIFAAPTTDPNNSATTQSAWSPLTSSDELYDVQYDGDAQQYSFYNKNVGKQLPPVKVMDKDEYRRYEFDKALRKAWMNRRDADLGQAADGEDKVSRLIAPIKLNSALASTLLGSDVITIDLQGNVETLFGYKWNFTDNPTIPEQYRSHGIFDFDVKYQLNASGQIGNRIKVEFMSSSDANFAFQDRFKVTYMAQGFGLKPDGAGEDDIIQRIDAGNVSLPLSGSLITGSQTLFGFRTDLKYGKLLIETIISQQKGEASTIDVQGGAQTTNFDIQADKYDANRHFFLHHAFRNKYNDALKYLPLIQSGYTITRLEVWVTNKNGRFENARNIVALDGLSTGTNTPTNGDNPLYNALKGDPRVRNMSQLNAALADHGLQQGHAFEKIENARLLAENEYTFHPQLGYISLNMALNNDEILAVAYEYTSGGHTYRVGELYSDVAAPGTLMLKLIKGTNLSPRYNTWALMMKNVYSLETYQLSKEDFVLDVMHKDDELGTYVPYISESKIKNVPLIKVLNLDNTNEAGSRFSDGRFDFVEGITMHSTRGHVIFPVLEPFGRDLATAIGDPAIAANYIYNELYDSTLVKAKQLSYKNKFKLSGRYKASSGAEILLGATDIPQGSVVVTAGGHQIGRKCGLHRELYYGARANYQPCVYGQQRAAQSVGGEPQQFFDGQQNLGGRQF